MIENFLQFKPDPDNPETDLVLEMPDDSVARGFGDGRCVAAQVLNIAKGKSGLEDDTWAVIISAPIYHRKEGIESREKACEYVKQQILHDLGRFLGLVNRVEASAALLP